jgi:peptide/nickel transport system substrate-binding protein
MSKRLVALFGVGVIVLAACGAQTTPGPQGTPTATKTPVLATVEPSAAPPNLEGTTYKADPVGNTGGTFVMGEWQTITSLNPFYYQAATDGEAAAVGLLGLVDTAFDLKYVPEISSNVPLTTNGGVTINGTKMDVEYDLISMNWSDGKPITCADLEATRKWIMDPAQVGLASGTVGVADISSVEDKGGGKCIVHYDKFFAGYIGQPGVLPAHYITTVPVADASSKLYPLSDVAKGVYNGPYMPSEYVADAQLTYKPNPEYWKASGGGTAPFDEVIFKYYPDNPDGMIAGFSAGEIDLAMNLNHGDLPKLKDMNRVLTEDTFTYEQFSINNKGGAVKGKYGLVDKFGEADVLPIKQALALATDKKEITTKALGGTVEPMGTNNISPFAWYFKQEPDSKYDPDAAKKLLTDAGWALGSDGFLAKGGKTLELTYCTSTRPYRVDTLNLVAAQLAKIGIKVDPTPVPAQPNLFGAWEEVADDTPCNLIHGNYDVADFAWIAPLDPTGSYNVYHTKGIPDDPPHSGQNNTRTSIPELDKAWDEVISNIDIVKIRDAMYVVQDVYSSNVIEIPLFYWKNVYLVNPKVHNVVGNPTTAYVMWNIQDWWREP